MFFPCDLKEKSKQTDSINYALFEEIFENVLDKCAPQKTKCKGLIINHGFTKAMRKAIMKRSEFLRNKETFVADYARKKDKNIIEI